MVPKALVLVALALVTVLWSSVATEQDSGGAGQPPSLVALAPDVNARLISLERAQRILFDALVAWNGRVDEVSVLARMTSVISDAARSARPNPDADEGFSALGEPAAEVIGRAHVFHREVVAAFAGSRSLAERKEALDEAVRRYRSPAGRALPDAPKDMTILYDHPYSSFVPPTPPEKEPRRELAYPALTGFMWSAHWYELAVLEPFESVDAAERGRALAIVADRFQRKLSFGAAPDAFPTELPLTPAIAPGLALTHERAASIIDNLNLMLDVLADVLVHPDVSNRQAAVNDVIAQFTDRAYRCVQGEEWMVVALRHSIFAQGGPALATMATYERNAFSGNHGQHYGPRRAPPPCDPE